LSWSFPNADTYAVCDVGALPQNGAPISVWWMIRPSVASDFGVFVGLDSSSRIGILSVVSKYFTTSDGTGGPTPVVGEWQVIGYDDNNAGGGTVRWHHCTDLAGTPTWAHSDGTSGGDRSDVVTALRLGISDGGFRMRGHIAGGAITAGRLGDAGFEALGVTDMATWVAAADLAWQCNVAVGSTALTDLTGGTANQTSLTGTPTLDGAVEPPNWTYYAITTPSPGRRRRVTTYIRGTQGRLNDIMTTLGTTTPSLWPFWETTGVLVTGISVGDLIPSETAGAAEALEDDFAPELLPCGLYSYHFHPTGDHHLAGIDHANFTFGNGTVDTPFSVGAWIRPNAIASNTIMAKYSATVREWRFWIDASGLLDLELYDESADTTEIAISTAALTIGQWVFVVASYDGGETSPVVVLYVNGAAVNDGSTTETGAYVAMEDTATPLTVGCSGVTATPVNEFHGRIALPFITGKALTAAEVTALYGYTAPMVGLV